MEDRVRVVVPELELLLRVRVTEEPWLLRLFDKDCTVLVDDRLLLLLLFTLEDARLLTLFVAALSSERTTALPTLLQRLLSDV